MEPEAFGYCWHRSNGEFYYGIHKGAIDDGYVGSGVMFRRKFDNTPRSEWHRTIEFRGSWDSCLDWEADMVTRELVETELCLNLMEGGKNYRPMLGRSHSEESKEKMRKAHLGHSVSKTARQRISEARKGKPTTLGKSMSEETKRKISKALQGTSHNRKFAIKTCKHCGTTLDAGNYGRYHGDRCKHKED